MIPLQSNVAVLETLRKPRARTATKNFNRQHKNHKNENKKKNKKRNNANHQQPRRLRWEAVAECSKELSTFLSDVSTLPQEEGCEKLKKVLDKNMASAIGSVISDLTALLLFLFLVQELQSDGAYHRGVLNAEVSLTVAAFSLLFLS